MDAFLQQTPEQQAQLCERAGDELGLAPAAVEKDFWVCWVLHELFALEGAGRHLTFKGGTSLSKCWGLIDRFSEDIDLVVDRRSLGFEGERGPEEATGNARRRLLEELRAGTERHVQDHLIPALERQIRGVTGADTAASIALDPDAADQQTILLAYPPLFAGGGYLRPSVKIEVGSRSDTEPCEELLIEPYVTQAPDHGLGSCEFRVRAVVPERTFWEKVALLHEHWHRDRVPGLRLARHYYDLWCLEQRGVADRALADPGLLARVARHRTVYFHRGGDAQALLVPGSVRLTPGESHVRAWRSDYQAMRDAMFFGEPPEFGLMMEVIAELEQRINHLPAARP